MNILARNGVTEAIRLEGNRCNAASSVRYSAHCEAAYVISRANDRLKRRKRRNVVFGLAALRYSAAAESVLRRTSSLRRRRGKSESGSAKAKARDLCYSMKYLNPAMAKSAAMWQYLSASVKAVSISSK